MANIEKFEEIVAWQKARELTREIYRITNQGSFVKDFGLRGVGSVVNTGHQRFMLPFLFHTTDV